MDIQKLVAAVALSAVFASPALADGAGPEGATSGQWLGQGVELQTANTNIGTVCDVFYKHGSGGPEGATSGQWLGNGPQLETAITEGCGVAAIKTKAARGLER